MTNTADQPRRSGYARSCRHPLVARVLRAGTVTACLGLLVAMAGPARALTIVPTFDSSVTSADQTTIDAALSFYDQTFVNPISVSIYFSVAPSASYAGQSTTVQYDMSYQSYTAALQTNALVNGNAVGLTAYNNMNYGNTAGAILATSADFRALGCSTCTGQLSEGSVTGLDGAISINANYFSTAVLQHEIDEVLGIGGPGSVLNTANSLSGSLPQVNLNGTFVNAIGPMDLFRYSADQTSSLTTSGTATSYFSIDGGATSIIGFNQVSLGDYGDWASAPPCDVQTWQACGGNPSLTLSSPEVTALQAIGYDLPVPEPAALSLLGVGLIALGVSRCRHSAN
jgi:hypothetical protein